MASYSATGVVQFDTDASTSGVLVDGAGKAKVNMGTGLGQVLQFTTASKLPALDGSLLTGVVPGSNSVGSAQIIDGSIVDADISNTAAIAWSKIASPTTLAGYNITDAVRNKGLTPGISSGLDTGKPATPVLGELYIATDAAKIYRWDGTATWDVVASNGGGQSFAIGTTGNSPAFSSSANTYTLNIPIASASGAVTAGLISNADYVLFDSKQSSSLTGGQVWVGNSSNSAQARALSGDIFSVTDEGLVIVLKSTTGIANQIVALDGTSIGTMNGLKLPSGSNNVTLTAATTATGTYVLRLPADQGAANQIMQNDGSGNLSWISKSSITDATKLPLAVGTMTGALITGAGTEALPAVGVGQTTSGLFSAGADTLAFSAAGTERMRIMPSGSVGIGTAGPGKTLDVNGEIRAKGYEATGTSPYALFSDNISDANAIMSGGNPSSKNIVIGRHGTTGTFIGDYSPTYRSYQGVFTRKNEDVEHVFFGTSYDLDAFDTGNESGISAMDNVVSIHFWGDEVLRIYDNGVSKVDYSDVPDGNIFDFFRVRGTPSSPQAVQVGDTVGKTTFTGYTGVDYTETANIAAVVEGVSGANLGSSLVFSTASVSSPISEKMIILGNGNVGIGVAPSSAKLEVNGHIAASGSAATLGACGVSPAIAGNDTKGFVTVGSGATTSCVINFNSAFSSAPVCTITWRGVASAIGIGVAASTTAMTVNFSADSQGLNFNYHCLQ